MSDRRETIMDIAERRIRASGYGGFSFRDIASDIGIKSASVHYHFPTKPDLAAAVAKRYRTRFAAALVMEEEQGASRVEAWRTLFLDALEQDGLMCLCGILAVEGSALPAQVAQEAHAFIAFGIASLDEARPGQGVRILSQLEGAMLIARATEDPGIFARATEDLLAA
ncbi:MAG: TetR/AcrR family transcriptional regulator [Pseudomonadota bacterium]